MENKITFIEQSMVRTFQIVWITREKKSFLSGLWLRAFKGTPLFFNLFAHVLAKGQNKYPYFKHYLKNIVLLTPGEHGLLDQGTAEERELYSKELEASSKGENCADWGKLEALRDELLAEYKEYFPSRRGLIIGYKYGPDEVAPIIRKLNDKFLEDTRKRT